MSTTSTNKPGSGKKDERQTALLSNFLKSKGEQDEEMVRMEYSQDITNKFLETVGHLHNTLKPLTFSDHRSTENHEKTWMPNAYKKKKGMELEIFQGQQVDLRQKVTIHENTCQRSAGGTKKKKTRRKWAQCQPHPQAHHCFMPL